MKLEEKKLTCRCKKEEDNARDKGGNKTKPQLKSFRISSTSSFQL
jgi:hypothetical protein